MTRWFLYLRKIILHNSFFDRLEPTNLAREIKLEIVKRLYLIIVLLEIMLSNAATAQETSTLFKEPVFTFSHKHDALITLVDGKEVIGLLRRVHHKKGVITSVELEVGQESKEYVAVQVAHMYVPPSNMEKWHQFEEKVKDYRNWDSNHLSKENRNDLVYFEQVEVDLKGEKSVALLQLLNKNMEATNRVYADPLADETDENVQAGIKVSGGLPKSYYYQQGVKPVIKLQKSDYKRDFAVLWEGCQKVLKMKPKWEDFALHVKTYNDMCAQ